MREFPIRYGVTVGRFKCDDEASPHTCADAIVYVPIVRQGNISQMGCFSVDGNVTPVAPIPDAELFQVCMFLLRTIEGLPGLAVWQRELVHGMLELAKTVHKTIGQDLYANKAN